MSFDKQRIKSRNWTKEETDLFVDVLTDPDRNFIHILEQKAMKRESSGDVYRKIEKLFAMRLRENLFIEKNKKNFGKGCYSNLLIDTKKLQVKYNGIKRKWRVIKGFSRNDGSVNTEVKPKWFDAMDKILTVHCCTIDNQSYGEFEDLVQENKSEDQNDLLEDNEYTCNILSDEALQIPTQNINENIATSASRHLNESNHYRRNELISPTHMKREICDNRNGHALNGISCHDDDEDPPIVYTVEEPDRISNMIFQNHNHGNDFERRKRHVSDDNLINAGEKRKSSTPPTDAFIHLADSISKLVERNLRHSEAHLAYERERDKMLLEFKRDEAERNRLHRLELSKIYLQAIQQTKCCCHSNNEKKC